MAKPNKIEPEVLVEMQDRYLELKAREEIIKERLEQITAEMKSISAHLGTHLAATNQKSFSTKNGMKIGTRITKYYNAADMDSYIQWAFKSGETSTLSIKLKTSGVDEYVEINEDLPPGIEPGERSTVVITVPRPVLRSEMDSIKQRIQHKKGK